ncbi:toll/interleukin-1 receptor domain-containing protein [Streptomyces rubiginosohelvolus]|uniref:toll/interleukin-1 receptor domain-containing protein n=1 Tax=Streptomyces rubiginosohelvolus TaxID=67362 RepID=UPI00365F3117
MLNARYDLFISHASEDKEEFVRPLAASLMQLGVKTWYDEHSLAMGDSLSGSIDKGLQESNYGLVVLSPSFLNKPWPEYEFRSLVTLEIGERKRILPVWYHVDRSKVMRFSPHLADRYAFDATDKGPFLTALEALRVTKPEAYARPYRMHAAERISIPREKLAPNPLLGPPLTQPQLRRIRFIREALMDVFPQSWNETVTSFRRDLPPYRDGEIEVWECVAGTYLRIARKFALGRKRRKDLFELLIGDTLGTPIPNDPGQPDWVRAASVELRSELPDE